MRSFVSVHRSAGGVRGHRSPAVDNTWLAPLVRRGVGPADAACCCVARPSYQVVMPPRDNRDVVELLFCAHHLRASLAGLLEAGAAVYDDDGALIESHTDVA
jgi:hypothetical protein